MGNITFTREQLYDLVWQQPISTLAKTLGVSGARLTNGCSKMQIPRPERGYWLQHAEGQQQRPLLLEAAGIPVSISFITGTKASESAREEVLPQPASSVVTPEYPISKLRRQSALVQQCRLLLQNQGLDSRGMRKGDPVDGLSVRVSPNAETRALAILDTLLKSLHQAGMPAGVQFRDENARGQSGVCFFVAGQEVRISIHENYKQKRKTETERRVEQSKGRAWVSKLHYFLSGQLNVTIESPVAKYRASWSDESTALEVQLSDIVLALRALPEVVEAHRIRTRQQAQIRYIEYEKQREKQLQSDVKVAYLKELRQEACDYQEYLMLSAYLDHVEASITQQSGSLSEKIRCALAEARELAAALDRSNERIQKMERIDSMRN